MQVVSQPIRFIPNIDRISVLSATILLAYTLTGIISIPSRQIAAQLPGFYIEFQINMQTVVSVLVTALAVSGTNWLLLDHPSAKNKRTFQHWLLPALTAWVIGIPLFQGALGPFWWVGILLGGGVLILVLAAEYVVVDPDDTFYSLATMGLNAVGYAIFLLLSITLRATQLRLYLIVPALTVTIALISLRTFNLRLRGQTHLAAVGICAVIMAELTTAAHYLPLSPIAFGLFLLGPAYGITNFLGNFATGKPRLSMLAEPLIILLSFWISALWLG